MTVEETKQAIAVMQAYVEGKKIVDSSGDAVAFPAWNWWESSHTYQVKPEPTLRPWTAVEAVAFLGEIVDQRKGDWKPEVGHISAVTANGVVLRIPGVIEDLYVTREVLAKDYRLSNGQPCGVLVHPV